jgi:sugar phosphate isomerase/epimerase
MKIWSPISRRVFLAGVVTLFGWMPMRAVRAQEPAEKLGFTLALHSYTFQRFTIFEAISKTAALGISHMSISGGVNFPGLDGAPQRRNTTEMSDADFESIQSQLREKGISGTFVNMGVVRLGADTDANRKVFEAAKRFGIPMLVSEPETHGKREELGPVMVGIEKLAKEYGIRVAIHNHPGPKNFYWNPDTVLEAVRGRSEMLGACADVGHWVRSGLDPVECLKKLEGRVLALHFKDLSEASPKAHDVPWGAGVSNPKAMLVELKRQGFRGPICIEYEHNWENSEPEIAQCVKWFKETCVDISR